MNKVIKSGTVLKAHCNYYSQLSGERLFTKGKEYTTRIGTNKRVYIQCDSGKSYELNVQILDQVFIIVHDAYDYAMAII